VAKLTSAHLHPEGEEPFVIYNLMAIDGGIGQLISNLDPWINLAATVKSAAAMPIANIACPIAIAGEY
jgi:hypothetical protein